MPLRSRRRGGGDDGQILPVLLTAIIAILAVTMLVLQVGRAGLLRTGSQTAADAAALAAVEEIRDAALLNLEDGMVSFATFDDVAEQARAAAEHYAEANGGHLVEFKSVGPWGRTVKVKVRSDKQGGNLDEVKDERAVTTAIASVHFPFCYPDTSALRDDDPGTNTVRILCRDDVVASYVGSPGDLRAEIGPLIDTSLEPEVPDISLALPGDVQITDPTRQEVVDRAREWLEGWNDGPVPYSMYGSTWNGYRRDCSAFISYAWGLGPPGLTTSTLPTVSHPIDKSELKPGDILLNNEGLGGASHVVMFLDWVEKGKTYKAIHQTPPHTTVEVLTYPYPGEADYYPYRYNGLDG